MVRKILFGVALASISAVLVCPSSAFDYCSITPKHTACNAEGYGSSCGEALGHGISNAEKAEIVRVHNELRAKIALGQESFGKPGPQPPAADMETIIWDDELAFVAQKHADQCLFQHDCPDCRKIPRFNVGQNLYIYKQSIREAPTNWTNAVTDWYLEVKLFDKSWVKPFRFSLPIGHYTAMLWSNTNKVGCGMTAYLEGKWFTKLYTCNYGPAGNYIGGQMYEQGPACSKCPKGTSCSREYPGLCASGSSGIDLNEISNEVVSRPAINTFVDEGPILPLITPSPIVVTQRTTTTTPKKIFNDNRFTPLRQNVTFASKTKQTTQKPLRKTITTISTTTTSTTTTTTPRTTTTRPTTTRTTTLKTTRTPTTPRTTSLKPSLLTTTRGTTLRTTTSPNINSFVPLPFEDSFEDNSINEVFKCDFDDSCNVKFSGKPWIFTKIEGESTSNSYYELTLEPGEQTEMFFGDMLPSPPKGVACLNFRYKKFLPGQGGDTPLQVVAWPLHGRPGVVKIQRNSPRQDAWVRAQVTFRKIGNSYAVLFRADAATTGEIYLALDDVSVTDGNC